jgi:tetratricopeptide (TPR) repeat protein
MNRLWFSIAAASVAAGVTAVSVPAKSPDAAKWSVLGEMVDGDVPATYRLPPVLNPPSVAVSRLPLFPAPLAPPVNWLGSVAVEPQTRPDQTPASPPLDDNLENCDESSTTQKAEVGPALEQAKPQPESATEASVPVKTTAVPPRVVDLTQQLLPAVQRGFGLAQRGAMYAARTEFVQVLRRVAQAHDAAADTTEHSRALAAGLRALDEAEDFVPDGVQLEAELDVRRAASSHRTNVLPPEPEEVSPLEAVALYHTYAQEQLQKAAAGEQAGSMALHGLGTINRRLAERNDDDVQLTRSAMTMYSAALAACPNNHLAANELGVLVCRNGRAEEAAALFMQTINFAPSAVAYHNLAIAQQRSGRLAEAAANEMESQRLAAMERERGDFSRRAGVRWVTPQEMARASQPVNRTPAMAVQPEPPQPPPTKSTWRRVVESTKALPFRGGRANEDLGPMPSERVARPIGTGPGNQSQWR